MSLKTTNLGLHKIELTDAPPDITVLNQNWDILDEKVGNSQGSGIVVVNATSTDGVAYTATSEGINELTAGMKIALIPNRISASINVTLNINGLGAKNLCMRSGVTTSSIIAPTTSTWLSPNVPAEFMYDGTQWIIDAAQVSAESFTGIMPVEKGGTGASTAAMARENLGAAPMYLYGAQDLTAGTSELASGVLYFCYE